MVSPVFASKGQSRLVENKLLNKCIALIVLIVFSTTVSCTTSQVHPLHTTLPQEKVQGIKIGDTVKVTTYDGQTHKFKVEQLTGEKIEGEGVIVALVDIERVEKVRITGRVVAIVLIVVIAVAALIFLGSKSEYKSNRRYEGSSAR